MDGKPKLMGEHRPVSWLCVDDLGAIAAGAFANPEAFIGEDLTLAADLRSIAECREVFQPADPARRSMRRRLAREELHVGDLLAQVVTPTPVMHAQDDAAVPFEQARPTRPSRRTCS